MHQLNVEILNINTKTYCLFIYQTLITNIYITGLYAYTWKINAYSTGSVSFKCINSASGSFSPFQRSRTQIFPSIPSTSLLFFAVTFCFSPSAICIVIERAVTCARWRHRSLLIIWRRCQTKWRRWKKDRYLYTAL